MFVLPKSFRKILFLNEFAIVIAMGAKCSNVAHSSKRK
jgi:hypothetical protein